MRRLMTYAGQIPLETDLLDTNKETMLALGYALQALIGTGTVADGLACTPTTPASMSVIIAPGSIYTYSTIDGSPYSSLGTDTGSVVKQGILYNALTTVLTAPGTVGYSINYLIQAEFTETDDGSVVLPYYNSSDPSIPWSGPSNSGAAQYTQRSGYVTLNVKVGTAAATGSQTTPAVDAGYVPLWVVTVAYGQTTITSGNISQHVSAPFIGTKLPAIPSAVQSGIWSYGAAGGTANALTLTLTPAPASLTALVGALIKVKSGSSANTGAMTINVNSLGAKAITTETGAPMLANAVPANSFFYIAYDGTQFQKIGGNYLASTNADGSIVQTAPYFTADGVAAAATYANNVASVSTDLAITASNFLDTGTTLSGGILTIGAKDAGVWQFNANLGINTAFNAWTSKVSLQKNGSGQFAYGESQIYGTPGGGNMTVSGVVKLAAGDTVRPLMLQNTGTSQTSSVTGHFSGSRIGK